MTGHEWRDILPIRDPDFSAEVIAGDPVELRLVGSADLSVKARLHTLIEQLHERLCATGAREVVADLRILEHMNASAFNALVGWIGLINDLPAERRYRIRFRASRTIAWQRRGLRTLACFATDVVVIES